MTPLAIFGWVVFYIAVSIGIHELGHYLVADAQGRKPKLGVDKRGIYVMVTKATKEMYLAGVVSGLFAVLLSTLMLGYYSIIVLFCYVIGTWRDIRKVVTKNG